MDEEVIARVKGRILEKSPGYFVSHDFAELFDEAGMENDPGSISVLLQRLAADDLYGFLDAIASGLCHAAPDGDGIAKVVSTVAGRMRHGRFQGRVPDKLVIIGRERPGDAVGIAARLVELGHADSAAYLIAGAYGGARPACDGMVESLLSSGDLTAAVRALRIGGTVHGSPGPERIKAAAVRALAHGGAAVQEEAMEALLDVRGRGDVQVEGMIEEAAARYPATWLALASRISRKSPFDDEQSLRHLETCTGNEADSDIIYTAYWALARIAGREPGGAARLLFRLLEDGMYHEHLAGRVFDELGRRDAPATILRLVDVWGRWHRCALDRRMGRIARSILGPADCGEVADALFRRMSERPGLLDACLSILGMLAVESHLRGRGAEFAARAMPRILEHAADAGAELDGVLEDGCGASAAECAGLIRRTRDSLAGGKRPPLQRIGVAGRAGGGDAGIACAHAAPGRLPGIALPGVRGS